MLRIRDSFKSYLTDELKNRKALESKIKAFYPKDQQSKLSEHISYMVDREHVDEDAYQCKYCTDLCYLSMAMCKVHTLPSNESTPTTEVSQTLTK